MQIPMRVEWTVPDEAKRAAARDAFGQDLRDHRSDLEIVMLKTSDADERFRIAAKRYPDLEAVIVHYGTLLSVRYVPEQWGVRTVKRGGIDATAESQPVKLCESKWVALVATEDGTREMDPRTLRVMWPMSAGDPIGGVVSWDELEQRKGSRAEYAMAESAAREVDREAQAIAEPKPSPPPMRRVRDEPSTYGPIDMIEYRLGMRATDPSKRHR